MNVALTIAGSDSGGGAGIQADIKAMQANGVFAASVITAITAQNTQAVTASLALPVDLIKAQIDAVMSDLTVEAVKTGMLATAPIIEAVAAQMRAWTPAALVVDPVMISTSGYPLLEPEAIDAYKTTLFPLATIITPNAHEAQHLTGIGIQSQADAEAAARQLHESGAQAVLIKGGHLEAETEAIDVLFDGMTMHTFVAPRIDTRHTHGTGCTYASSIAANLARGYALAESIERAKRYVTAAIEHGLPLGKGHGPTHHFYFLKGSRLFPADDDATGAMHST